MDSHSSFARLSDPERNLFMLGRFGSIELAERQVGILHGDDAGLLQNLIRRNTCHVVLTGHTHAPSDTMQGATRVLNPGALSHPLAPSLAVLDLAAGQASIHRILRT